MVLQGKDREMKMDKKFFFGAPGQEEDFSSRTDVVLSVKAAYFKYMRQGTT